MVYYRRAVVAFVGLLLLGSLVMSLYNIAADVPVLADIETLPTIIIDAGHGGVDGGAVAADGTVEKDLNLAISLKLRDMFLINGFDVVMTRDTDISIHDEGVEGVRKQKTSDLHNRLAIAESHPNAVFISVHQNKFGEASSHGTQVFYSPNNPESERLAQITQALFVENLQPENKRQHKEAGKNLYLMYESKCPAILLECGFLSNAGDLADLKDDAYQSKVAFTTFCSVMRFLGYDAPAVVSPAPSDMA